MQEYSDTVRNDFLRLEWMFLPIETLLDSPTYSHSKVALAANLLHGGRHLSEAISEAARLRHALETQAGKDIVLAFGSGSSFKPTNFLKSERSRFEKIDAELSIALGKYSQIPSLGDAEFDARFASALSDLSALQTKLRFFLSKFDTVMVALGDNRPERYLVLNQNRDELRATGGFPGSAVFIELYKGRIEKYEKKDIYYYDWHLFPLAPKSPPGIDRISEKWGLRDANYYPEMERNFRIIDDFYQKSGGSSLNGLIVMNQKVIGDFLQKYGPVRIDSINRDITADNFSTLMSVLVENRINSRESAKDVLFEFVESLERSLSAQGDYSGYFDILTENAKAGEILAYSDNNEVNALFETLFPGEVTKHLEGNFVYPLFTSLSGNKSDRYVRRKFEISGVIQENLPKESTGTCFVRNHFTLESDHTMSMDDKEKIRKLLYEFSVPAELHEKQIFIQGNGTNRQYVRILVPKGSKLVGSPPIQIETDDSNEGYTVFSWYLSTEVGQTSGAFFDYESPLQECSPKPLFFRQPGLANYSVTVR